MKITLNVRVSTDNPKANEQIPDSDLKDEFKGEPAQRDLFDIPIEGLNGGLP